jgi:HlyD family secretion protein
MGSTRFGRWLNDCDKTTYLSVNLAYALTFSFEDEMVDVARDPAILRRKRVRQIVYVVAAGVGVAILSVAVARMEPAAPSVERATVLIDTVKRGSFVRQVRGLGTLVPEDTRWLPATTDGRIERIRLRPGAVVRPDSVILDLGNPQVEQEAVNARLALQSAEAALENLRVQLQNELLTQQAQVATIESDYKQAQMDAEANDELAKLKLMADIVLKQSILRADTLRTRYEIEKKRLAMASDSIESRTRVQQAAVDQARAVSDLHQSRLAALMVRPGFAGVLQQVPVEVGQQVAPGQNLARVADPGRLKAELRIPETQARDVEIGQLAYVDTRNGIIPGRVSRKDPAATNGTVTVDVTLTAELPRGAVPDLSVDGTIELERVESALQVGRPAFGQEQSTVALFRVVDTDGHAERVQVRVGRSSVNAIEIVSGLNEGDQVVLSDMSAWDAVDRVRLR